MFAKILMQQVWHLGVGWDAQLPDIINNKINIWIQSTKYLKHWVLPRIYFPDIGWDAIQHLEIHGFCDASLSGYGTVVYLCNKRKKEEVHNTS